VIGFHAALFTRHFFLCLIKSGGIENLSQGTLNKLMHIPGHLAVVLTQYALPPLSKNKTLFLPLLAGGLFPDVVDKTIGYGLKWMPNGRHFAHNIFSLLGLSGLVSLIWGAPTGLAWFWGYLGHLLLDCQGEVPWVFPLKHYPFKPGNLDLNWARLFKETGLLGAAIILYVILPSPEKNKGNCHSRNSCYNNSTSPSHLKKGA
jgi:hypothetical protein